MRLLVVGAGSTGGYFGGRLAQANRDVTFLVRPRRAEQLRQDGLRIISPYGDVTLRPVTVTADSLRQPYDVILLAVKAYSLDDALAGLAPAVGPDTLIVPVLNGMKHLEVLAERFGPSCVIGGLCLIFTTVDDQGRIIQLSELQEVAYGELDGTTSARIQALDDFMKGAGFNARLSTTIKREMWEKWILLASMGGINCLLRGNVGEIQAVPGGTDLTLQLLQEVTAVVEAVGVRPSEAFLTRATAALTASGSKQSSSMYRDLERGSAIEADQIIGDLLLRARRANIPTPLLALAYTQLSIYQNRHR